MQIECSENVVSVDSTAGPICRNGHVALAVLVCDRIYSTAGIQRLLNARRCGTYRVSGVIGIERGERNRSRRRCRGPADGGTDYADSFTVPPSGNKNLITSSASRINTNRTGRYR